jgi:hypothetical protein
MHAPLSTNHLARLFPCPGGVPYRAFDPVADDGGAWAIGERAPRKLQPQWS